MFSECCVDVLQCYEVTVVVVIRRITDQPLTETGRSCNVWLGQVGSYSRPVIISTSEPCPGYIDCSYLTNQVTS